MGVAHVITTMVDESVIWHGYNFRSLSKALKDMFLQTRGIPRAEVSIRRNGEMVAWMKFGWNGRLEEVDIYGPVTGSHLIPRKITPMNPGARMFRYESICTPARWSDEDDAFQRSDAAW